MGRRLYSNFKLEKIYFAAIRVLETMGMRVENHKCLEALENFGAKVDYSKERVIISHDVVKRMLEIVRNDGISTKKSFPSEGKPGYGIGAGGTCPFYLDEETGEVRRPTEKDCIEAYKVIEVSPVQASGPPVSNRDCHPKFEAIRILQLGIETLSKTILGGTDLFHPEQIPYAMELGELYKNDAKYFVSVGNCPISPLTIGKVTSDLAVAKAKYEISYAVPVMPVSGSNAPVTAAGTAVVGVAEILGSYCLAKALNPRTPVYCSALTAMTDLRNGNIKYITPEVFIADRGIIEVFECYLGLPCSALGVYCDARLPGLQASWEKITRSMGIGMYEDRIFVGESFDGTVDQGRLFSPSQLILDNDIHEYLAIFKAGPVVEDETLAVDVIIDSKWDSSEYLINEHTLMHMREGWRPKVFDFGLKSPDGDNTELERKLLKNARHIWQESIKKYEPPNHSDSFLKDLRSICDRAKKVLCEQ